MTKLRVKTTSNYIFEIEVELDDTVADVKRNIENSQGADSYPADRLIVVHVGKILKDETTLKENEVTEKSLLYIVKSSKKRGLGGESLSASTPPAKKLSTGAQPDAGVSLIGQSTDSAAQTMQKTEPASTGPNVTPLNLFPREFSSRPTVVEIPRHPCEPYQIGPYKTVINTFSPGPPAAAQSTGPNTTPLNLFPNDRPRDTQSNAAPATGSGTNETAGSRLGNANQLTNAEQQAVDRLVAMGFSREAVMEAFLVCNKNEEVTANYLIDHN